MTEATQTSSARIQPLTIALVLAAAAMSATIRVVPYEYRLLNFVPLGAVALFAGARLGLRSSIVIALAVQVISDLLVWVQHDRSELYTPWFLTFLNGWSENSLFAVAAGATVYSCLLGYAVLGRGLKNTKSPAWIGLSAISAGMAFFLITNFVSWLVQMTPYGYTLEGLLSCYLAAIPFYRGTFISDLTFTGVLFSAHAVMVRMVATSRQTVAQSVEVRA